MEKIEKTVKADESNMRLDRWFKLYYPAVGFSNLQKLLRTGQIRIDGKRSKAGARLQKGNIIRIPPLNEKLNQQITIKTMRDKKDKDILDSMLLFENKELYVFNKPSGLAVQGGSGILRSVDSMLESLRDKSGKKPRLVHRLDRDTSGILLVAKTRTAAVELTASFRKRTANKIYWALVAGIPPKTNGRLSCYLQKFKTDNGDKMRLANHGQKGAVHAISHYRIIDKSARKLTWVELIPTTGRTHQLRVQMAELGNSIIGDNKYFKQENWQMPNGMQQKLHLHARHIEIDANKINLEITAPLPPHMQQSWNLFGFTDTDYEIT